jgi:hypothetical protein
VLASAQWILLSGLRHITIGSDTYAYKVWSFDPLLNTPWGDAFRAIPGTYLGQLAIKDPGYGVFVKILQMVSSDYQVFLVLIALIFTVPLGVFIYRNSPEPCLSFLVYSCLFASFYAITGIRQTVATALVVLVGYEYIKERRLLPFLALSIVAFTIHKSSLVFLPFYFIAYKKPTRVYGVTMLGVAAVVFVFRSQVMSFLGNFTGYEQFTGQWAGAGAYVFAAMLLLVAVVALWRAPKTLEAHPDARIWYNALFVALVLTPLAFVDPSAMRVVQYFSMFLMLLVPAIIQSFKSGKERALVYYIAASALLVLFARADPQYLFFWQGL